MSRTERSSGKSNDPGRTVTWPLGVGLGAALGYLLDPESGRRRRRHLQDKAGHFRRIGATGARKALADAENRVRGVVAEVRSRVTEPDERVPDDLLLSRVRSRLGHIVTHPRAIDIHVARGRVTLSGPTLAAEADNLIRQVRLTPGVHDVVDELERFESARDVPSLQGGRERRAHRFIGNEWAPAYRMLGVAASLPLLGLGLQRRGASGGVVAGLGASLLTRAVSNMPLSKLTGVGAGADAIELRKHLSVSASPEEIFSHLQDPDNVRELISQIKTISPGGRRSTWEVVLMGPASLPMHCEVELTDVVPNEHIAWRSLEGGRVQMEGTLHISRIDGGGSELELELYYNPPGGLLGEALATLLGAGLRHGLTEDLPRIQRTFAGVEAGTLPQSPSRSRVDESTLKTDADANVRAGDGSAGAGAESRRQPEQRP